MSQNGSTSAPCDQKPPGPFDQSDLHHTLAIDVEGRRFWVSRELLADYSPVFKKMLYGDFNEANKDAVELPKKKAVDFEQFLLCMFPTPKVKKIDYTNVKLMLAYADEYDIDDLRQRSADALIEMATQWGDHDTRLREILQIASDQRFSDALRLIVKKCAFGLEIKELEPMFKTLRPEIVAAFSLYKSQIPRGGKCKFGYFYESLYHRPDYCNIHKNGHHLECVYCKASGCTKCLEENKPALAKAVCGMPGIAEVERAVHELLDRLADD